MSKSNRYKHLGETPTEEEIYIEEYDITLTFTTDDKVSIDLSNSDITPEELSEVLQSTNKSGGLFDSISRTVKMQRVLVQTVTQSTVIPMRVSSNIFRLFY